MWVGRLIRASLKSAPKKEIELLALSQGLSGKQIKLSTRSWTNNADVKPKEVNIISHSSRLNLTSSRLTGTRFRDDIELLKMYSTPKGLLPGIAFVAVGCIDENDLIRMKALHRNSPIVGALEIRLADNHSHSRPCEAVLKFTF